MVYIAVVQGQLHLVRGPQGLLHPLHAGTGGIGENCVHAIARVPDIVFVRALVTEFQPGARPEVDSGHQAQGPGVEGRSDPVAIPVPVVVGVLAGAKQAYIAAFVTGGDIRRQTFQVRVAGIAGGDRPGQTTVVQFRTQVFEQERPATATGAVNH